VALDNHGFLTPRALPTGNGPSGYFLGPPGNDIRHCSSTTSSSRGAVIGSALPQATGQASGTSQTLNELGGALGIAVLGSLGTALYRGQIDQAAPAGVPSAEVHTVHDTLAGAASVVHHLPTDLMHAAQTAFTHGMSVVALVTAPLMLGVAALLALALRESGARSAMT
jgi:MFS transporter, DHA2 family, multidrug resistance protein